MLIVAAFEWRMSKKEHKHPPHFMQHHRLTSLLSTPVIARALHLTVESTARPCIKRYSKRLAMVATR